MCKNGLGLFAQKWLILLEIWWIKFLQNDKQHLLLKLFTKIFIFDRVIAIFMFFDEWWRHVLVHLKKIRPYKDLAKKNAFFEERSWFKFNNLGLALVMALKFYTSVAKRSKLKVRKLLGLVITFIEVTGEKLVESLFCTLSPSSVRFTGSR